MVQSGACSCTTLLLLVALACGDGPTQPPAGPPAQIDVVSGAAFTGSVGTQLAIPLGVRVTDKDGRAVTGAIVRF